MPFIALKLFPTAYNRQPLNLEFELFGQSLIVLTEHLFRPDCDHSRPETILKYPFQVKNGVAFFNFDDKGILRTKQNQKRLFRALEKKTKRKPVIVKAEEEYFEMFKDKYV